MSFILGFVLGVIVVYLYTAGNVETALRARLVEEILGFNKEDSIKWLNNKNPGLGLKKPSELNFEEFFSYLQRINYGNGA